MNSYLDLLKTRGVARIMTAQLVARFPFGMLSLAFLLHIERLHDSYGVAGLVLAATSAGMAMAPGDPRTLARLADPAEYTVPKALQRNLAMLYAGGGDAAVSLNAVTPPSPTGYLYQIGALAGWSSVAMLPLLDTPTLVMAGDDDKVVPPSNAQFLHTLIPGSRLKMFAGGGHLFMLSHLAEFAESLNAFLDLEDAVPAPA